MTAIDLWTTSGWKYQVEKEIIWTPLNKIIVLQAFDGPYYSLQLDGTGIIKPGCCYNGADCFPDVSWMKFPSLMHDFYLWCIERGLIPENQNNVIDAELGDIIARQKIEGHDMTWFEEWLRYRRSRYIEKATKLAKSRKGDGKKIHKMKIEIEEIKK